MGHLNAATTLVLLLITAIPTAAQEAAAISTSADPTEQSQRAVPEPAHTGWATLVRDTGRDFSSFPRRRSTWVLLAAGGAAALTAHPGDHYVERHVGANRYAKDVFKLGRWVGSAYVQTGASVGLWAVGRYAIAPAADGSRTNKVSHLGFDLMRAQIVTQSFVQGTKFTVRRDRPTGECCAFPSGHAASAFAAASVLERHLGYRASVPALAIASYIAASRVVDDRHFVSDVIFGAALGEAAGWTVVGRHGRNQFALEPVRLPAGMMIALVRTGD